MIPWFAALAAARAAFWAGRLSWLLARRRRTGVQLATGAHLRALAYEDFGVEALPGETDVELRDRCFAAPWVPRG